MPTVSQQNGRDSLWRRLSLNDTSYQEFRRLVLDHYNTQGHTYPWRETFDPYCITVSEFMLQQTQTSRVVPFYTRFILDLPTWEALSKTSLQHVLTLWNGLGYNRRAKALYECAQVVMTSYQGTLPNDVPTLMSLPGIGKYTAAALQAFIWQKKVLMIETNIRSALIAHFFSDRIEVRDFELEEILSNVLERSNPRIWYYALMDYGKFVKSHSPSLHQVSAHYRKQSPFRGSLREVRGALIRELTRGDQLIAHLHKKLPFDSFRIDDAIKSLQEDQLVKKVEDTLTLDARRGANL
jgi:A/G-specific adenine glycosylase